MKLYINLITKFILLTLIFVTFSREFNLFSENYGIGDNDFDDIDFYKTKKGDLQHAINKTKQLIQDWQNKFQIPGIVAGISIKGKNVWIESFGITDIENDVSTKINSVWRIASISKSLTSTLIAKLIDEGKLELNQSIYKYLNRQVFPFKKWNGKIVDITLRQVMSHTAGLASFSSTNDIEDMFKKIDHPNNVTETLIPFKDKPLIFKPGTNYSYSNFGYHIVGAIIESVLKEKYEVVINKMFKELGMSSTFPERREQIIKNRARYYMVNSNSQLLNTHIVDDLAPLKLVWPAGGLLSTVPDLLKFGNIWLNSLKANTTQKTFIKSSTVKEFWRPETPYVSYGYNFTNLKHYYAKGWVITNISQPFNNSICQTPLIKSFVSHAGGWIGATTILAIFPDPEFVVAILTNIDVGIRHMPLCVARNFVSVI